MLRAIGSIWYMQLSLLAPVILIARRADDPKKEIKM
jgi:hypothetical protein